MAKEPETPAPASPTVTRAGQKNRINVLKASIGFYFPIDPRKKGPGLNTVVSASDTYAKIVELIDMAGGKITRDDLDFTTVDPTKTEDE